MATAAANTGLMTQFVQMFRLLRVFAIVIVVGFLFTVGFQAVQIFTISRSVHPMLGVAWLLLCLLGAGLIAWPIYRYFLVPRVICPPERSADLPCTLPDLIAQAKFVDRYFANCRRNPLMKDKDVVLMASRSELASMLTQLRQASPSQAAEWDRRLGEWIGSTSPKVLSDLDAQADRLIYQEALAVGLATAASPNGALDGFFMLWRSLNLASKLAVTYYGRPGLTGTLVIFRDVTLATLMAGYLQNVTDSLGSLVAKQVSGVTGMLAGPAVEGIANALVLIRIGYLIKERCRSFQSWDGHRQQSALMSAMSSTQRVAVSLTTEIARQAAATVGQAAGMVARTIADSATTAADGIAATAVNVYQKAVTITQTVAKSVRNFRAGDGDPRPPESN